MTFVLIDAKNALFRFGFSNRSLHSSSGQATGAVYGVLGVLLRLKKKYPDGRFAMCWDVDGGAQNGWRRALYSGYKANRQVNGSFDTDRIAMFSQIPYIKRLGALMNIPQVEIPGHEADDLICLFASRYMSQGKVVVYSGDHDFWQLVPRITILTKQKDGESLHSITAKDVAEKFRCKPEDVLKVRAIAGDGSDGIPPAVRGIGVVKASVLVAAGANPALESFEYHSYAVKQSIAVLKEAWGDVRRNYQLMALPLDGSVPGQSGATPPPLPDLRKLPKRTKHQIGQFLSILSDLELSEAVRNRSDLWSIQSVILA